MRDEKHFFRLKLSVLMKYSSIDCVQAHSVRPRRACGGRRLSSQAVMRSAMQVGTRTSPVSSCTPANTRIARRCPASARYAAPGTMKVTVVDPVAPTAARTKPSRVTASATDVVATKKRSANPARNAAGRRTPALSSPPILQPAEAPPCGRETSEQLIGSHLGSQARAARAEMEMRQPSEG